MTEPQLPTRAENNAMVRQQKTLPARNQITPADALYNIHGAEEELGQKLEIYRIQQKPNPSRALHDGLITTSENKQVEAINFVWLAMSMSRVMWPEPYNPKNPPKTPLCKSLNGITPCAGTAMLSGPCKSCPKSQWGEDAAGNQTKPECSMVFNLACWDVDEDVPFVLPIKRTGIKVLRAFNSKLTAKFCRSGGLGKRACVCRMTLRQGELCYLPVFEVGDMLDLKTVEYFNDMAAGFIGALGSFDTDIDETALDDEVEEKRQYYGYIPRDIENVESWEDETVPQDWLPDKLRGTIVTFKEAAQHRSNITFSTRIDRNGNPIVENMRQWIAREWSKNLENPIQMRMALLLRDLYPKEEEKQEIPTQQSIPVQEKPTTKSIFPEPEGDIPMPLETQGTRMPAQDKMAALIGKGKKRS